MEGGAAKRSGASRRQPAPTAAETASLLATPSKPQMSAAPLSGILKLPLFASAATNIVTTSTSASPGDDNSTAKGKKRRQYQVNFPVKMVIILGLVFVVGPLLMFVHKEVNIHEAHNHAHFKPEKYVNVNTEKVFAQFGSNQTQDEEERVNNSGSRKEGPAAAAKHLEADLEALEKEPVEVGMLNATKSRDASRLSNPQQPPPNEQQSSPSQDAAAR